MSTAPLRLVHLDHKLHVSSLITQGLCPESNVLDNCVPLSMCHLSWRVMASCAYCPTRQKGTLTPSTDQRANRKAAKTHGRSRAPPQNHSAHRATQSSRRDEKKNASYPPAQQRTLFDDPEPMYVTSRVVCDEASASAWKAVDRRSWVGWCEVRSHVRQVCGVDQ